MKNVAPQDPLSAPKTDAWSQPEPQKSARNSKLSNSVHKIASLIFSMLGFLAQMSKGIFQIFFHAKENPPILDTAVPATPYEDTDLIIDQGIKFGNDIGFSDEQKRKLRINYRNGLNLVHRRLLHRIKDLKDEKWTLKKRLRQERTRLIETTKEKNDARGELISLRIDYRSTKSKYDAQTLDHQQLCLKHRDLALDFERQHTTAAEKRKQDKEAIEKLKDTLKFEVVKNFNRPLHLTDDEPPMSNDEIVNHFLDTAEENCDSVSSTVTYSESSEISSLESLPEPNQGPSSHRVSLEPEDANHQGDQNSSANQMRNKSKDLPQKTSILSKISSQKENSMHLSNQNRPAAR